MSLPRVSSILSCYTLLLFMMERVYALTRPLSSFTRYMIHSNPKGRLPVSVIVLCFVFLRYSVSILVLQSSRWGGESWLLCFVCLPGVS